MAAGESVIGALRVVLGLDTAKFQDDLKKSQGLLGSFSEAVGKIAGGITVASLLEKAFDKIKESTLGAFEAIDQLGKTAQKVGIPVEQLSALSVAAKISDVSMESLSKSLGILSKNMVDAAKGGSDMQRQFQALGISVTNADGSMRSVGDVLLDLSDKFHGSNDGAQKTATALNLLGRAGKDLIPLLNQGSGELRELMETAQKMGLVISKDTANAVEHVNDNFKIMHLAGQGLANMVIADLVPAFVRLSDQWVDTAKKGDVIRRTADTITSSIKELMAWVVFLNSGMEGQQSIIGNLSGFYVALGKGDLPAAAEAFKKLGDAITGSSMSLEDARKIINDLAGPLKVTINHSKDLEGEQSKLADTIAGLNLQARALDGTFQFLPAGFAQLAANLNLTDKAGDKLGLTFDTLTKQQQALALAQADLNSVQAIQNSLPAWQQLDIQLQKIETSMRLAGYTAEQTGLVIARTAENSASSWKNATVDITTNIASAFKAFAAQNKNLSAIAKAAAIAQAVANTYVAATKALSTYPPPLSYAAAAAAVVAGLGMVAQIQAQQFATGGSFTVGGGITGLDSQLVAFKATPGEMVDIRRPGQGGAGSGSVQTIELKAPRVRDLFSDHVRDLVDVLNAAAPDGYRLKMS